MARRVCPKCAEFIDKKAEVCPFCGEILKPKDEPVVIKEENFEENLVLTQENQTQSGEESPKVEPEQAQPKKRHAHKKKKQIVLDVKKDNNGDLEIATDDVTFFEGAQDNYGVKKARGEVKKNKPEWWEIYKWADIWLARRKINKEVNKAAIVEPEFINHWSLLVLAILFGWMGGHNYYARNFKKAIFVTISFIVSIVVINVPAFTGVIDVSIGGGFGFIVLLIWVWDVIGILTHKFKFRESKLKFIAKLNQQTRSKLGKKYENIKDWFVPYEERKQLKNQKKLEKSARKSKTIK